MSSQTVVDVLEDSHDKLVEVRSILDRADSALAVADEVVVRAEEVLVTGRKAMPVVLAVVGVAALVGVGVVLWRRSARKRERAEA